MPKQSKCTLCHEEWTIILQESPTSRPLKECQKRDQREWWIFPSLMQSTIARSLGAFFLLETRAVEGGTTVPIYHISEVFRAYFKVCVVSESPWWVTLWHVYASGLGLSWLLWGMSSCDMTCTWAVFRGASILRKFWGTSTEDNRHMFGQNGLTLFRIR